MPRFLKEIYLTAFVVFFRTGGSDWTPGINAGKGVAGVALIESAFLIGIAGWVDVAPGNEVVGKYPKMGSDDCFLGPLRSESLHLGCLWLWY